MLMVDLIKIVVFVAVIAASHGAHRSAGKLGRVASGCEHRYTACHRITEAHLACVAHLVPQSSDI